MAMSFTSSTLVSSAPTVGETPQLSGGEFSAVGFVLAVAVAVLVCGELLIALTSRRRPRSRFTDLNLRGR